MKNTAPASAKTALLATWVKKALSTMEMPQLSPLQPLKGAMPSLLAAGGADWPSVVYRGRLGYGAEERGEEVPSFENMDRVQKGGERDERKRSVRAGHVSRAGQEEGRGRGHSRGHSARGRRGRARGSYHSGLGRGVPNRATSPRGRAGRPCMFASRYSACLVVSDRGYGRSPGVGRRDGWLRRRIQAGTMTCARRPGL